MSKIIEDLKAQLKQKEYDNSWEHKIHQERFQIEMKKNKDAWIASEKVRREKWEQEQVMKIKESTIKGLEPEIQKIMGDHAKQIKKIKEECEK